MKKHNLVIKPRESDYVQGINSPIVFKAVSNGIWPVNFNEDQRNPLFDDDGCACYDIQKRIDSQIDILLNTAPSSLLVALTSMGFMDTGLDGAQHFHSSPRFTEIMTGNGLNGNSSPECCDAIRANGLVPWKLLPFDQTMNEQDYFNPVNLAEAKTLGQQFLSLIGGKNFLQYHWILDGGTKNVALWQSLMLQAPLGFGIAVDENGWNQPTPTDPPAGQAVQHAVMCYEITAPNCFVNDNYDPYDKGLDAGYPIPYCIQAVVTLPIVQEQEIVSQISDVVSEIPAQPVAEQPTLIEEVKEIINDVISVI